MHSVWITEEVERSLRKVHYETISYYSFTSNVLQLMMKAGCSITVPRFPFESRHLWLSNGRTVSHQSPRTGEMSYIYLRKIDFNIFCFML